MSGMMRRMWLAAGFMVFAESSLFAAFPPESEPIPALAPAAPRRQEIKSMDILDRPNRAGHFYGNTVRRRHSRHLGW